MSTLLDSIKTLYTILLATMIINGREKSDWLLKIVITQPYVMMGKAHNLTKIINSGIVLGAYMPSKRKSVLVSPMPENPGHMLFSRPVVKNVSLNMVTKFNDIKDNLSAIPNLSTLIIEVLFGDASEDAFEILPGLSIKWLKKHERRRCSIIYVGASPVATLEGVQIIKGGSISLTKIFMPYNLHLMGLMYTLKRLKQDQL